MKKLLVVIFFISGCLSSTISMRPFEIEDLTDEDEGQSRLTFSQGSSFSVAAAFNTERAFYTTNKNGSKDIFSINLRKRKIIPIFAEPYDEYDPSVSSDNKYLTFVSKKDDPLGDVYLAELKNLTSGVDSKNKSVRIARDKFVDESPKFDIPSNGIFLLSRKVGQSRKFLSYYSLDEETIKKYEITCQEIAPLPDENIACVNDGVLGIYNLKTAGLIGKIGGHDFVVSQPAYNPKLAKLFFVVRQMDTNKNKRLDANDNPIVWSAKYNRAEFVDLNPIFYNDLSIISPFGLSDGLLLSIKQDRYYDLFFSKYRKLAPNVNESYNTHSIHHSIYSLMKIIMSTESMLVFKDALSRLKSLYGINKQRYLYDVIIKNRFIYLTKSEDGWEELASQSHAMMDLFLNELIRPKLNFSKIYSLAGELNISNYFLNSVSSKKIPQQSGRIEFKKLFKILNSIKNKHGKFLFQKIVIDKLIEDGKYILAHNELRASLSDKISPFGVYDYVDKYIGLAEKLNLIETAAKDLEVFLKEARIDPRESRLIKSATSSLFVRLAEDNIINKRFKTANTFLIKARQADPRNMKITKIEVGLTAKKNCLDADEVAEKANFFSAALVCSRSLSGNVASDISKLYTIKDHLIKALSFAPESGEVYNLLGWTSLNLYYASKKQSDKDNFFKKIGKNIVEVFGEKKASLLDDAIVYFSAAKILFVSDPISRNSTIVNLGVAHYEAEQFALAYANFLERIGSEKIYPFGKIDTGVLVKSLAAKSAFMIGQYSFSSVLYDDLSRFVMSLSMISDANRYAMLAGLSYMESNDFKNAARAFSSVQAETDSKRKIDIMARAAVFEVYALVKEGSLDSEKRINGLIKNIEKSLNQDPFLRTLFLWSKKKFNHNRHRLKRFKETSKDLYQYMSQAEKDLLSFGYQKRETTLTKISLKVEELLADPFANSTLSNLNQILILLGDYIDQENPDYKYVDDILLSVILVVNELKIEERETITKKIATLIEKDFFESINLESLALLGEVSFAKYYEKKMNYSNNHLYYIHKKKIDRSKLVDNLFFGIASANYDSVRAEVSESELWIQLLLENRVEESFDVLRSILGDSDIKSQEMPKNIRYLERLILKKMHKVRDISEYHDVEKIYLSYFGLEDFGQLNDDDCAVVRTSIKEFVILNIDGRHNYTETALGGCKKVAYLFRDEIPQEIKNRLTLFLSWDYSKRQVRPAFFEIFESLKKKYWRRHILLAQKTKIKIDQLDVSDIRLLNNGSRRDFDDFVSMDNHLIHLCDAQLQSNTLFNPLIYLKINARKKENFFLSSDLCDSKLNYKKDFAFTDEIDLDEMLENGEVLEETDLVGALYAYQDLYSAALAEEDEDMALEALDLVISILIQINEPKQAIFFQLEKLKHTEDDSKREIYSGAVNLAARAKEWELANRYLKNVENLTEKESPGLLETYRLRAVLKRREKQYEKSIDFYQKLEDLAMEKKRLRLAASAKLSAAEIFNLYLSDGVKSEKYYLESIELYEKSKSLKGKIKSTMSYAGYLTKKGNFDKAVNLLSSLGPIIGQSSLKDQALYLQILGNARFQLGQFDKVYQILGEITSKLVNVNNLELKKALQLTAQNLRNLTELETKGPQAVHRTLSNVNHYGKGLDNELLALNLSNNGYLLRMVGKYGGSILNHRKAIKISREVGNEAALASDYRNLGLSYLANEDYEQAEIYLNKSIELSDKLGLIYNKGWTILGLIELNLNREEFDIAGELLSANFEFLSQTKSQRMRIVVHYLKFLWNSRKYKKPRSEDLLRLIDVISKAGAYYNFKSGKSKNIVDFTLKDFIGSLLDLTLKFDYQDKMILRSFSRLISYRESLGVVGEKASKGILETILMEINAGKLGMREPEMAMAGQKYIHFFASRETVFVFIISESDSRLEILDASRSTITNSNDILKRLIDLYARTTLVEDDLFEMIFKPIEVFIERSDAIKINPGSNFFNIPLLRILRDRKQFKDLTIKFGNSWAAEEQKADMSDVRLIAGDRTKVHDLIDADIELFQGENKYMKNSMGVHISAHGEFADGKTEIIINGEAKSVSKIFEENRKANIFSFTVCDESPTGSAILRELAYTRSFLSNGVVMGNRNRPTSEAAHRFLRSMKKEGQISLYESFKFANKLKNSSPDPKVRNADFAYYYVHSLVAAL